MNLREMLDKILDELRGAWRFRWLSIAAAWAICVIGWFIVTTMPNTYKATAKVYVDTRGILRPLLEGLAINPDVASGLDLVRQALLSTPQLEQVARETDLDLRAKTPEEKQALITSIRERISIDAADLRARTTQGEGLYVISFEDRSREKSIEVVQKMLNAFVENALGEKRTGQETAQRFIDEQIAEYEQRLRDAESRLAEFKQRNVGLMPDSTGDYFGRMQQETAEAERVRTALAVAESRKAEIDRQLEGEEPFLFGFDTGTTTSAASPGSTDITFRIQDLQRQLDELLLKYTDKHPEVIATRKTIAELKERQAEELARIKAGQQATGSLSSSLKTNPVYQSLEIEQKRTQVQVAELRQELAQRYGKIATLRKQVNSVPEVEAELARLNRDYEQVRQQYNELVQRRETAKLSEQADRTGTVKFDIIEPPAAPIDPVAPNRPQLLFMVLLAALAVAGGGAWLMNQLRPVFHTVRALTEVTGVPVFGAISRTWVDRHRQQRRTELLKFSAATLLLFLVFGAFLALQGALARHLQNLIG
ncbi:MAG: Chromosome partition protein Smc [Steroidobacteraceae bacterium]|nr:Chromosome partition protein Smc [Steroidobacteraceae bacterium]